MYITVGALITSLTAHLYSLSVTKMFLACLGLHSFCFTCNFVSCQTELDNVSALLEESEKKGVKMAKEVDKLNSKLQDLEVQE